MGSENKKKNKRKNKKNKIVHDNEVQQNASASESEQKEVIENDDELEQQILPPKRTHSDEDPDTDEQPRKKKKKKQLIPTDSGDKKGKKSIRQIKREKHAQRQAEKATAAKDQFKSQCISYLSQWKHDRQNWKFMKTKQVWLYKNKFSPYLLPDSSWPVFLEYFESAKGNIRNLLLEDANKVIKQMDEWSESQNQVRNTLTADNEEGEKEENNDGPKKPENQAYKRARDLIQCLQE